MLQNWAPRLLVYGDMGKHGGAESLGPLTGEVKTGDTHAILHIGDFAYDFDSDGGVVRLLLHIKIQGIGFDPFTKYLLVF